MTLEAIQAAITQLPVAELEAFRQWFEKFLADRWDAQIEADIRAGRLDTLGERADESWRLAVERRRRKMIEQATRERRIRDAGGD